VADEELEYELKITPDTSELVTALDSLATTVDDIANTAMKRIESSLKEQSIELAKMQKLMDPAILSKTVELGLQRVKLSQELAEATKLERESQQGMTDAAKEHLDTLAKIKEASGPDAIREQVRMQLELNKARKAQAEALEAEMMRQSGTGWSQKYGGQISQLINVGSGGSKLQGMGGLVGGAVGGPIGQVLGSLIGEAVGELPGKLGEGLARPAQLAAGALSTLSSSLKELSGALGQIGIGFDLVTTGLGKVAEVVHKIPLLGGVLGPLVDNLAVVPGIFKSIVETLVGFTAQANPALYEQYQIAIQDVQAVIGNTFLPVLSLMRDGIRLFGDTLAELLPNSQEVSASLTDVYAAFSEFRKAILEMSSELGPIIRSGLVAALNVLGQIAREVASYVTYLVKAMTPWIAQLREFLGLHKGPARSSIDAAARPAQMSGIDEYQRQLQLAAFSAPGTAQQSDLPTLVLNIQTAIDNIWRWLQEFAKGWEQTIVNALKTALTVFFPHLNLGPTIDRGMQWLGPGQGAAAILDRVFGIRIGR
jgi:hypothetical protein